MSRRLVFASLLAGLAHSQIANNFSIQHSTLPNGLELLLHTEQKSPIVHLNFRFRVGSKHEAPGQHGLAHLFEHLIFQDRSGTPISTPAEQMGATNFSGSTLEDFTEFYDTVPSARLERVLWMESNRFSSFLENLTQENLDRQREVVINELRLKSENEAYARVNPTSYALAFPPGHPYQHGVGGDVSALRSLTLDDVRSFYRQHYTSDQLTLAIVGDFDPTQARQWVTKYFGPLVPGDGLVSPPRSAPPLATPKSVQIDERVRNQRVHFIWVGPPGSSRDNAALEFAALLLSDDFSPHHLHKALGDQLSQGVSVDHSDFLDASFFDIYVTVVPGASVTTIDEKIGVALARFAQEGPTAAEIERTRNKLESNRLGELESISGIASTLQYVHQFYGSTDRWGDFSTRYSSITAGEIRASVNRWLVTPSHLTIDVRPLAAVRSDTPEPDRKTPPPFQSEKPFTAPEVQTARLANGLQILLLERHDLPKVAVRLQFRAGAIQSPTAKPALMALAAASGKGSTTKKDDVFDRSLADLGTGLSGDADVSSQDFRFEVLRKNLEPAFRLFADGVLHTDYPDWSVEARKKDWIAAIENPEASLDDYARQMFAAAFGANHPLGLSFGTPESLRSITTADVRDFHDRYWKPNIAALIFAGDITLKDAVALATDTLGGWSGTTPPVSKMPPAAATHDRIVFVDRKGVTQTMVVQVLPGVSRDHPDYPALLLADRIYGGMSSSRIWENIRQQHGIAYYAHSELNQFPAMGLWIISSPVEIDKTALAMREFESELAAFGRAKPITQTELDQARTGIVRSLPEQFETLGSSVGTISSTWAWGLPLTDIRTFPQRLTAVTVDEVNAIARKYARAEQGFFVLVGDRQKIEPQLH